MTARYASTNRQKLTRAVLFRALESVILAHASLGLTILDDDTPKAYFARLKEINLDEIVSFVQLSADSDEEQQREIDQILSEQHSTRFQELGRLPAWRVLVLEPKKHDNLRGVDVMFIYHHGIGDGGTGQAFHMALLKALDNASPIEEEVETKSIINPPAIPLLGSLEAIIPLPLSYKFLLTMLWTRAWFPRKMPPTFWCGSPIHVSPDGLKTSYQTLVFPSTIVNKLLAACRAEKTTITALLQVLIAKSFFFVLPAGAPSPVTDVASAIAINMRRFMPEDITDETMGVFTCSTSTNHSRDDLSKSSIWDLARSYRTLLEDKLKAGTRNTDTGLLKLVPNYEKFFKSKLGERREQTFELSNLGVFKGQPGSRWNIPARMIFSQSASVAGAVCEVSVISVKGGEMCVGVSYQEGAVEKELVEKVLGVFRSEVERVSGGV